MKILDKMPKLVAFIFVVLIQFAFAPVREAYAATTPAFGQAASFGILSSTYTNTVIGTTINGDLGYTTGPAVSPTVNGTTNIVNSKYNQAGTDQADALAALNGQACTSLGVGAVNLDNVAGHTTGIYTPGCYSSGGAMNITAGQSVTLQGSGTYIFRPDGALTPQANTSVVLSNGASSCNVFWTPTGATTLGANSAFVGTDIDAAGITIGSTVSWTGRALAFGGTVSTAVDTITVPTCNGASNKAGGNTDDALTSPSVTGGSTTPFCPAISSSVVAPLVIESKRTSPTSILINWGPYSGVNTFNVQYGLTNGNWLYSTNVTGFSTTINNLPVNQPIWIRVAARNDCSVGTYGQSMLVGGLISFGQNPNLIGVGLPNAGFAPLNKCLPKN